MVAVFIKIILYRVISPACLIFAALIRPSLLSLLYALLALLNPLFPRIRASYPLSTPTKVYLTLIVLATLCTSICQLVYQIAEHVITPEDSTYIEECKAGTDGWRYWLRQFGFTRVPSHEPLGFRFMLPEIVALISSLATLVICLTKHESTDLNETVQTSQSHNSGSHRFTRSRSHPGGFSTITALKPSFQRLSDILLTFYTLFMGIIQPSILNSFYFFMFLFLLTWYALYTPITRRMFNNVKFILIFYSGLHLLLIYTYQIQVSKDFLQPDHLVARLLGFTDLARSEACETWWQFKFNSYWTSYVNYIALWIYFFCAVAQFNWTRTGIRNFGDRDGDGASSDHEELLASVPDIEVQGPNSFPLQRITSQLLDRQKISVIFRRPGEKETTTTEGLTAITFFFLHHSYVFQLIAMMTWALLYHSVFGLIFLFLACILWALRDSRKWCFRISPIMLAYVEILLIFQYIYSLDLIAGKELPVYSGLEIIGFQQAGSRSAAFLTLGVKSILSLPFFVILRLFLRERFYDSLSEHDRRKRLNYGTFGTPPVNREPALHVQDVHTGTEGTSPFFKSVTKFLTKFWLFLVAFVLLVNALSSPPVDYTAGYLVLFCVLIILLHISFRFFRNVVFIFWTLLIIYSSIILLAVYTYQFPSIPKLWQDKTNLTSDDFAKIGLVDYQDEHSSSLLFVRLLLPILLVLVTMLQLKFFHDPWTKLVQTPSQSRATSAAETESEESKLFFHPVLIPRNG
uniref:Piezo-type mechanosensitive ion channel component n=1 Tax=Panagrolaimus sp. PS1159 TaxID=55785 RepID=A0AC35FZA8_9BILA